MGQTQSNDNNVDSFDDLKNYINTIAADVIITSNFKDRIDLKNPEKCNELMIMTEKIFKKNLKPEVIRYLVQERKRGEIIDKNETGTVYSINKNEINDLDIKNVTDKRRACIGLAEFYIKIFNIFSAIMTTIDKQFIPNYQKVLKEEDKVDELFSLPSQSNPLLGGDDGEEDIARGEEVKEDNEREEEEDNEREKREEEVKEDNEREEEEEEEDNEREKRQEEEEEEDDERKEEEVKEDNEREVEEELKKIKSETEDAEKAVDKLSSISPKPSTISTSSSRLDAAPSSTASSSPSLTPSSTPSSTPSLTPFSISTASSSPSLTSSLTLSPDPSPSPSSTLSLNEKPVVAEAKTLLPICVDRLNRLTNKGTYKQGSKININPQYCSLNEDVTSLSKVEGIEQLETLYKNYNYSSGEFKIDKFKVNLENDARKLAKALNPDISQENLNNITKLTEIRLQNNNSEDGCRNNKLNTTITRELSDFKISKGTTSYIRMYEDEITKLKNIINKNKNKLINILKKIFNTIEYPEQKSTTIIRPDLSMNELDDLQRQTRNIIINNYILCQTTYNNCLDLYIKMIRTEEQNNFDRKFQSSIGLPATGEPAAGVPTEPAAGVPTEPAAGEPGEPTEPAAAEPTEPAGIFGKISKALRMTTGGKRKNKNKKTKKKHKNNKKKYSRKKY